MISDSQSHRPSELLNDARRMQSSANQLMKMKVTAKTELMMAALVVSLPVAPVRSLLLAPPILSSGADCRARGEGDGERVALKMGMTASTVMDVVPAGRDASASEVHW